MYAEHPHKISPETVYFTSDQMRAGATYYILRPEAVESMFYMWRHTKDPKYREWGWEVVKALNLSCRTSDGFAYVAPSPPETDDFVFSPLVAFGT